MTDRPFNPIPQRIIHPASQFFIFIGLTILAPIVGTLIGSLIVWAAFGVDTLNDIAHINSATQALNSVKVINALWIIQLIGTTLPLLFIPTFLAYVIVRQPDDYLKTTFHFPALLLVLVLAAMIAASPLIEFLSNINQEMVLPAPLKGIERWMRESEDSAQKLTDAMLQMKTFGRLLFNLIFVGLLTAVVEEFMFRGCLQTIFTRWTKNYHVAIWLTAILFSAFHMEFYGFLPRLLLGALFGYFVAWSGSVWPAVWAHFINNGSAVIITYLFQHHSISLNPDDQHVFSSAGYVISLVITSFLMFAYQYVSTKQQSIDTDGEELD